MIHESELVMFVVRYFNVAFLNSMLPHRWRFKSISTQSLCTRSPMRQRSLTRPYKNLCNTVTCALLQTISCNNLSESQTNFCVDARNSASDFRLRWMLPNNFTSAFVENFVFPRRFCGCESQGHAVLRGASNYGCLHNCHSFSPVFVNDLTKRLSHNNYLLYFQGLKLRCADSNTPYIFRC